jgi:hypothetical protein
MVSTQHRHVPRAPLPAFGVTSCGVISCTTSEGTTPPSSLIQAHAPVQVPPPVFGCPYYSGSSQVAASPCWKMDLPDFISAILAQALGPLPRSVLPVLLLASSRKTTTSPQTSQVRHTRHSLQCNFNRVFYFGVAVISLCSGSRAR